jgi:hypothetical protein
MQLRGLPTDIGEGGGPCYAEGQEEKWHNCLLSQPYQISVTFYHLDRLCGLVVRVLGYRSGGPGPIPGTTRKKK